MHLAAAGQQLTGPVAVHKHQPHETLQLAAVTS